MSSRRNSHVSVGAATTPAGVETILLHGTAFPIVRKIGEGAYSTVFLCENPQAGGTNAAHHRVAMKRTTVPDDRVTAAHEELALLDSLTHPCIVGSLGGEVSRVRGQTCVVQCLEYCPGRVIDRMLDAAKSGGGALPLAEVVTAFASVATAVQFLHAMSPPVTHRDIKPENILIAADGSYKLCDFGSATRQAYHCATPQDAAMATEDAERHTTLLYRAPEMVDPWRRQRIDERCDVWALGVLLYYLLFFKFPFEETSLAILRGTFALPETFAGGGRVVPAPLLDIILGCLVPDPDGRLSAASVVALLRANASSLPFLTAFGDPVEALAPLPPSAVPQDVLRAEAPRTAATTAASATAGTAAAAGAARPATNAALFAMLDWAPAAGSGGAAGAAPRAAGGTPPVAATAIPARAAGPAAAAPPRAVAVPPVAAPAAGGAPDLFGSLWGAPTAPTAAPAVAAAASTAPLLEDLFAFSPPPPASWTAAPPVFAGGVATALSPPSSGGAVSAVDDILAGFDTGRGLGGAGRWGPR